MYEELLVWSRNRPIWQQDALRRLAQNGELTTNDLAELELQIRKEAGFPTENALQPEPLAAEHLSQASSAATKLVLASLGPVQHVDRLTPNQPPLRFAVNGVTVVYGSNASGKSGYCRIAKRLCRSQRPVELHGNVYGDVAQDKPEVKVAFRVGGDDQPKDERIWHDGQEPPSELSRISVFDAASARVYVDEQRKIEFLPYELDLLKKLGLACQYLEKGFKERFGVVNKEVTIPFPEGFHEGTTVQVALASLAPSNDLVDMPSEQSLRALGTWTTDMQAEIAAAEEQLKQDPKNMISLRINAKRALEIAKGEISNIEDNLADTIIAAIRRSQQTTEACRRAAEVDAKNLFKDQPIADLGSETWRNMLIYAREFAATIFSDMSPPQLANGGLCVLCQQDLNEDASVRLREFDKYISGRAAEESVAAEQQFAKHQEEFKASNVKQRDEIDALLSAYTGLPNAHKDGAALVATFVEKARERLKAVKDALQDERYDVLDNIDPLPSSPANFLEKEINRLKHEITELEKIECDEAGLDKLRAKQTELSDRKQLSETIESIIERRNYLEEHHRLTECRSQCRSGTVTRRITDRRREILTPELKKSLRKELKRLQLTHIPLDLSDHGKDAESIIEIELEICQQINKSDILSEGEQRALALACFLAELHEIGSDHAIIVDDPVSSLDHGRMNAVAKRLAEEASCGRQVIVFTHSILFHHMLWTETRRVQVGLHCEWMSSEGNDKFGLIGASGPLWQMKDVRMRLKEIKKEFQDLINRGYDHKDQKCRPAVIGIYTKMRETWERTIEDVLLNKAVQRFRPEIMTQRLEAACIDPSTDYPAIFEGMKRCSHYSGHDPASDIPSDLPTSDQIACDISDLKSFSEAALKRRAELGKKHYEKGVEPMLL